MRVIKTRNVQQALPEALDTLRSYHHERGSRNGPVWVYPEPVTTVYLRPTERVLFWEDRDANPFFHLFESLWMLAGRQDVAWLEQFNSRMRQFSDNGETFHGAYGYRWRHHFGFDQLPVIADNLKKNPECRRQVLAMWDAEKDLGDVSKDLPCNDLALFTRGIDGELNMTVMCRSNDIIWGCYGANAVHFSILLEFMAAAIGCPVGTYTQISNNWHGYVETTEPLMHLADRADDLLHGSGPEGKIDVPWCPYENGAVEPFPLINTDVLIWQRDLGIFMSEGATAMGYRDRFFRRVAIPLLQAYQAFKDKELGLERFTLAQSKVMECQALD
ncbi:unnamed protein product, partial [marine sediment metagenome]